MNGVYFLSTEVILRNYSVYNQYILWDGHKYKSIVKDNIDKKEQGIAGYTKGQEVVGVFIRNPEVFFLYNDKEYIIDISNFKCSNSYI